MLNISLKHWQRKKKRRLLLDSVRSAVFASAFQKLKSDNVVHSQVRRSSDQAEFYIIYDPKGVVSGNSPCYDVFAVEYQGVVSTIFAGADGYVSRLFDLSGNGNDAMQTSAAAQPKIIENGNILGHLVFDGADDYLETIGGSGIIGGTVEVNIQGDLISTPAASEIFLSMGLYNTDGFYLWKWDDDNTNISIYRNGGNSIKTLNGSVYSMQNMHYQIKKDTQTYLKSYLNNNLQIDTLSIILIEYDSSRNIRLGDYNGGGYHCRCNIKSLIIFNSELTDFQRTLVYQEVS